jgi:hypothetical protein
MRQVVVPAALLVPAAFVTTQDGLVDPLPPGVKVMVVPVAPDVIEPPVIVQA